MKHAESDAIRREVAFNVMGIVKALIERKPKAIRMYQNYLPTYELKGCSDSIISHYFCPLTLEDKGKRRIYVNKDDVSILYFSRKSARKLAESALKVSVDDVSELEKLPEYRKIVDSIGDRWIVAKTHSGLSAWDRFRENVICVEVDCRKDNHPPCGAGRFVCVRSVLPSSLRDRITNSFNRNFMTELYLCPVSFK